MTTAVSIFAVVSLVLVGLWGFWIWKRASSPERMSFHIGAWSAAFGTLILGFLIALSVYYIQEEQQRSAEESQAGATKARLLSLFNTELSGDLQALKMRVAANQNSQLNTIYHTQYDPIYNSPLKSEFWRIISTSGDMKVLNDLDVVYALSQAYENIAYTDYWEHRLIDVLNSSGIAITVNTPDGGKMPLAVSVLANVVPTYEPTRQAVETAIGALKTPTK